MRNELLTLVDTVNRELGTSVTLNAAATGTELPEALRPFYQETDGLKLPFVEIWPAARVAKEPGHGWLAFGQGGAASVCLCRPEVGARPALGLWDRGSGRAPEGAFSDVLQLLHFAYEECFADERVAATLHIVDVPRGVQSQDVVRTLKRITARPTGALLQDILRLPFAVASYTAADGIRAVRELQHHGVICHLRLEKA